MWSALILSAALTAPADVSYIIVDPPPVVVQERLPVLVVPRSVIVIHRPYVSPPVVVDGPLTLRPVMPLRRVGRWLLGIPQPPDIIVR